MKLADGTEIEAPRAALTLHRWWAHAICYYGKDIENRSYEPPAWLWSERRPFWLAIHAGAQRSAKAENLDQGAVGRVLVEDCWIVGGRIVTGPEAIRLFLHTDCKPPSPMRSGEVIDTLAKANVGTSSIVAVAEVDRMVHEGPWYVPGQIGWHLSRVFRLTNPISARGLQRVWRLNDDLRAALDVATLEPA